MTENDFPTIIGADAKFKGDLSFDKSVKVLGSFEGRIDTKGDLLVASGGMLQADVEAGNIVIEGELNGNVAAKDMVELKESARLQGDLRCERLIVTEGARFVGHCSVGGGIEREGEDAPEEAPPTDTK